MASLFLPLLPGGISSLAADGGWVGGWGWGDRGTERDTGDIYMLAAVSYSFQASKVVYERSILKQNSGFHFYWGGGGGGGGGGG